MQAVLAILRKAQNDVRRGEKHSEARNPRYFAAIGRESVRQFQ